MNSLGLLLLLLSAEQSLSAEVLDYPTTLYTVPTPYEPAFCNLHYNPTTKEIDLAYSSFTGNMNRLDRVFRIPSVSKNYLNKAKMISQEITDTIYWPNEIGATPIGAFEDKYYWTAATAFFLIGKDNGTISLMDMTDPDHPGDIVDISSTTDDIKWYYHRVLWEDLDYDGDLDAISARAYGNATEAFEMQLVWFENPGMPLTPNWEMHLIYSGYEDVSFRLHHLPLDDGTDTLVIISAGFFSQALTLTWTTDGDWENSDSIQHRVVDDYGYYFDLNIADLNADGVEDILITTWYRPEYFGSVVAYEVPKGDWRTDEWPRHTLSTDFRTNYASPGNGAPGLPIPFWRTTEMKENKEKPHLIVSGDDDGHAYLMVPNSTDTNDWGYTKTTIYRAFGTIGAIAVGDVDADGFTELFIPAYSTNHLVVMSYKP